MVDRADRFGMMCEAITGVGHVLGLGVVQPVLGWSVSWDMESVEGLMVWLFPAAAAFVALWGVGMSVWGGMAVSRAKYWHTTEGRVVESKATSVRNHASEIGTYSPPIHCANVTYEYSVNGQKYRSSRIKVGGDVDTSDPKRAKETVERFTPGDSVVVYYDPMKPEKAALEIDSSAMFLGVCMALGGAVFAIGSAVKAGLI